MSNVKHTTIEKFPTWAICAVVNDDRTGLTEEDENTLDLYLAELKESLKADWMDIVPVTNANGNFDTNFSHYPEFGLATEVCEVSVIYQ